MLDKTSHSEILNRLCALPPDGSGALEFFSAYASERDELKTDALGSVIWERAGDGRPVLLESHLDTIAMIVTAVLPDGFLRVQAIGGVDRRPLAAQTVNVWGKKKLTGIVTATPPHLKEKDDIPEWADTLVDIGRSCVDFVSQGDLISLNAPPVMLFNDNITAAGLDNRAGCAAVLRALMLTKDCPQAATAVFAVREETNGSGALTAAYAVSPKSAVAVDVSFAQCPQVTAEQGGEQGGGVMLGISPVLDGEIIKKLRSLALQEGIPLQSEVMGSLTGTDADKIQTVRSGIPTGLLSIPLKNMHTAAEIVSIKDIENTARLLAAYLRTAT